MSILSGIAALYARDSVSMASQAIAQDFVTLVIGIPLLIISFCSVVKRDSARGWFLLTGTLGYALSSGNGHFCCYRCLYCDNHTWNIPVPPKSRLSRRASMVYDVDLQVAV